MKPESFAILLRIYIGESDKLEGKPLYQYIVEYLRQQHFAGVTVLRGLAGYGLSSKIHSSDLLTLSSDLPIVIEVIDTHEKIVELKQAYEAWDVSGLITEEKVMVIHYGKNHDQKS
jgi:hypothetical protein